MIVFPFSPPTFKSLCPFIGQVIFKRKTNLTISYIHLPFKRNSNQNRIFEFLSQQIRFNNLYLYLGSSFVKDSNSWHKNTVFIHIKGQICLETKWSEKGQKQMKSQRLRISCYNLGEIRHGWSRWKPVEYMNESNIYMFMHVEISWLLVSNTSN